MLLVWRNLAPGDGPPINTSVTQAETDALRRLAARRQVLEVGAAYGYSTVAMAQVATYLTSVDPHAWLNSCGALDANLAAYGVAERVRIDQRWSYDALPDLADQGETFDLIFVDGDHDEQAVAHDVGWARKLLAPGGVLCCHDYGEDTCPGVRAALDCLLGSPPKLIDTLAIYPDLAA